MPVINTDAVLWYNVGQFGQLGYGVPNPSDDPGSLNPAIIDFVNLTGRNLFHIMHHEDVDLRTPPSINTIRRVHKLYVRLGQILASRAVPPGELNLETQHVQPAGEVFRVFPIPFFKVRNHFLKRWGEMIMIMLSEAMQHTENRKSMEISTVFGKHMTEMWHSVDHFGTGKERRRVVSSELFFSKKEPGNTNLIASLAKQLSRKIEVDAGHVLTNCSREDR